MVHTLNAMVLIKGNMSCGVDGWMHTNNEDDEMSDFMCLEMSKRIRTVQIQSVFFNVSLSCFNGHQRQQ